jgi:hypothetical protein
MMESRRWGARRWRDGLVGVSPQQVEEDLAPFPRDLVHRLLLTATSSGLVARSFLSFLRLSCRFGRPHRSFTMQAPYRTDAVKASYDDLIDQYASPYHPNSRHKSYTLDHGSVCPPLSTVSLASPLSRGNLCPPQKPMTSKPSLRTSMLPHLPSTHQHHQQLFPARTSGGKRSVFTLLRSMRLHHQLTCARVP